MKRHITRAGLLLASCLALLGNLPQTRAQRPNVAENYRIVRLLDELVEMKDFQNPMSLKEAIGLLMEKCAGKGKDMPIHVDVASFRGKDPDGADLYATQVSFMPYPRQLPLSHVLETMLSKVKCPTTFLIRNGMVVVTTAKDASVKRLLQRKVMAEFANTPFSLAIEELSAQTGASIVLDNRLGDKLKAPVTASLRNDVTLEATLRMLADMTDLKVVFLPSGIYVSHPFNAHNMERELAKSKVRDAKKTKK